MTVRELRDKIIKQDGLTALDIVKGFHCIQPVKLSYEATSPEVYQKDVEKIQNEYVRFVKSFPDILPIEAQKLYEQGYKKIEDIIQRMKDANVKGYEGESVLVCIKKAKMIKPQKSEE